MSDFPHVQLVTEPEAGATVLFDFNTSWTTRNAVQAPNFTLGVPEVQGAPDAIGVEYGPRAISFTGEISGSRLTALTALSSLARLLLKSKPGWLRVSLSAFTKPVWFELQRPEPEDLSFDRVFVQRPDSDVWETVVRLWAEPFAVGARITLPAVSLSADVANAAGCEIALPEIIGDAPAPLRITVRPGASGSDGAGTSWLMSCAPLKADVDWSPIVWQVGTGDGFTAGADTGAGVANAAYSGGSYRSVTFALETGMATRISGPVPAPIPPGRYKVLVRVSRGGTLATFALRFGQKVLAYFYDQPTVTMDRAPSTGTHRTWVDLGEFQFPRSLPDVPSDSLGMADPTPDIALDAEILTGVGADLKIDAFKLVPIELVAGSEEPATTMVTELPVFGIGQSGVWDGTRDAIWAYNDFGILHPAVFWPRGAFPVAVPGAQNILTVMPHVGGGKPYFGEDNPDSISDVNEVEVSYQPRWLWLADRDA